ncbi:MAG TPA: ABC transporter permease subunit [Acidimicrobiales bacterium]|nr:ABC transporter permease subunit [Acidimicrobiales bacterium]
MSPALTVVTVLFLGGLAFGLAQSFGWLPFIGQRELSLDAYRALWRDPAVRASVVLTLRLALTATALAAVLAVVGALLIRSTRRGRRLATVVFQANLPVPHIVGAAAMLALLSQSGLLSRVTTAVGLTDSIQGFPPLVADRWGVAIIAEFVWKEVPFIGTVVLAVLASGVDELEDVARSLGAGPWQRFRHVVLPLITPAVAATSIIVFAFSFGSYEIPFLLGRSYPVTLPVLAYQAYTDSDLTARSTAMAIAVVIAVLVGLLVAAYLWLSDRYLRPLR